MNNIHPSAFASRSTPHGTLRTTLIRSVRSALTTNTTGTRDASLCVDSPSVVFELCYLTLHPVLVLKHILVVFAAEENPVPAGCGRSQLRLFLPAPTLTRRSLQAVC